MHPLVGADLRRRAGHQAPGRCRARGRGRTRPSRGGRRARRAPRRCPRRRAPGAGRAKAWVSSSPRPEAGSSSSSTCGLAGAGAGQLDQAGLPGGQLVGPDLGHLGQADPRQAARWPRTSGSWCPARSAARRTLSWAVRTPNSSRRWNVRARPSWARRWVRSRRDVRVRPAAPGRALGGWRPVMTLNSVVLPAPLGPMSPVTCAGSASMDTSSRATLPPKRTVTSRPGDEGRRAHPGTSARARARSMAAMSAGPRPRGRRGRRAGRQRRPAPGLRRSATRATMNGTHERRRARGPPAATARRDPARATRPPRPTATTASRAGSTPQRP